MHGQNLPQCFFFISFRPEKIGKQDHFHWHKPKNTLLTEKWIDRKITHIRSCNEKYSFLCPKTEPLATRYYFWATNFVRNLVPWPCWPLMIHGKIFFHGQSKWPTLSFFQTYHVVNLTNLIIFTRQFFRRLPAEKIAGKMIQEDRTKRGQLGKIYFFAWLVIIITLKSLLDFR